MKIDFFCDVDDTFNINTLMKAQLDACCVEKMKNVLINIRIHFG